MTSQTNLQIKDDAYYARLLEDMDKRFFGSVPQAPKYRHPGGPQTAEARKRATAVLVKHNRMRQLKAEARPCVTPEGHAYKRTKWKQKDKFMEVCAHCRHTRTDKNQGEEVNA